MKKQQKDYEVAYICNGKNPQCEGKLGCYYRSANGYKGPCIHTLDKKYAMNKRIDPEKDPDRFEIFRYGKLVRYYERFPTTD